MLSHGISALNWVWNCSSGLFSTLSPPIHILAGEKVCSQVMMPTQLSSWLASRQSASASSGDFTSGLAISFNGKAEEAFRPSTTWRAVSST